MSSTQEIDTKLISARVRNRSMVRGLAATLAGVADAATILAVAIATGVIYHQAIYADPGQVTDYLTIGLLTVWLYLSPKIFRNEYSPNNYLHLQRQPERIIQLWSFTFVCLILLAFLTKVSEAYSRGWIAAFYIGGALALLIMHIFIKRLFRWGHRTGLLAARRMFLVGDEADIRSFVRRHKPWHFGLEIVGVCHLDAVGAAASTADALGDRLQTAVTSVRILRPDCVLIVAPWSRQDAIARCLDSFMTVPISIHLSSEPFLDQFKNLDLERLGPIASLHLLRPPLSRFEISLKRCLDAVISATALLCLLPLFALVAFLIRRDSPGPILFWQTRYGFNQRPFRILKFRTMTTQERGPNVRQATIDDQRVTRIGRFLRRWNIDELPQLLNVLTGEMSLVGPRPHALVHDESWGRDIAMYARRHNVKPGITGWAQVNGFRGNIDSEERLLGRVACDLYYIDNWSLFLDLKIILLTIFSRRAYTNAY